MNPNTPKTNEAQFKIQVENDPPVWVWVVPVDVCAELELALAAEKARMDAAQDAVNRMRTEMEHQALRANEAGWDRGALAAQVAELHEIATEMLSCVDHTLVRGRYRQKIVDTWNKRQALAPPAPAKHPDGEVEP